MLRFDQMVNIANPVSGIDDIEVLVEPGAGLNTHGARLPVLLDLAPAHHGRRLRYPSLPVGGGNAFFAFSTSGEPQPAVRDMLTMFAGE